MPNDNELNGLAIELNGLLGLPLCALGNDSQSESG